MSQPSPRQLENLGRAIRVQRARQKISQEVAAQRGGMHRNAISAIERGEINPTYGTLLRIADGLGVPLHRLIREATSTADSH